MAGADSSLPTQRANVLPIIFGQGPAGLNLALASQFQMINVSPTQPSLDSPGQTGKKHQGQSRQAQAPPIQAGQMLTPTLTRGGGQDGWKRGGGHANGWRGFEHIRGGLQVVHRETAPLQLPGGTLPVVSRQKARAFFTIPGFGRKSETHAGLFLSPAALILALLTGDCSLAEESEPL